MNDLVTTEIKIVYNGCYGGFNLSHEAMLQLAELKGVNIYPQNLMMDTYIYWLEPLVEGEERHNGPSFEIRNVSRHDKDLVRIVEEMGDKANGFFSNLKIEIVKKGTLYRIDEYDGYESVICQYDDVWSVAE